MKMKPAYVTVCCLVMVLGLLALSVPVRAEDGDPDGLELKTLHEDPGAPKISESKVPDPAEWNAACVFETRMPVGQQIWEYRWGHDSCGKKTVTYSNPLEYCQSYSAYCGHWIWKADCLKEKGCP